MSSITDEPSSSNSSPVDESTITALRRHNDALAQRVDGFKQMFEEQDAQFANLQVQVEAVCEENAALRKELEVIKEGQAADPTTVSKKD
ncbi:Protein CBG21377 [Caenorhabditis briggsae]|uniref:Protein CBG21377 n=1 Tax=Caenorhabditis briggsae TaxID=6238 RepID=A8XZY6_CAEBR|nr:Protein CBG21377 [Caenorhabditis briggsae]CAP38203.1 Protein CBG21377 [Caenorhabditis briggsae]